MYLWLAFLKPTTVQSHPFYSMQIPKEEAEKWFDVCPSLGKNRPSWMKRTRGAKVREGQRDKIWPDWGRADCYGALSWVTGMIRSESCLRWEPWHGGMTHWTACACNDSHNLKEGLVSKNHPPHWISFHLKINMRQYLVIKK